MEQKTKDSRSRNVHYWRLLVIDGDISNNSYPNSTTLSEKYDVSIATIKRDIDYMIKSKEAIIIKIKHFGCPLCLLMNKSFFRVLSH